MLEKTCNEFIENLASKAPIPGGGGASAYVGALGMALGSMVGNLTLGKKKYKDVEEDIKELLLESYKIMDNLKELAEMDGEVFYPLSQAYGLPQNTDEEKEIKEKALQEALVGATLVPLEIARWSLKAIDLHEEFAKKGTKIAISDVGVGAAFCKAAIEGAKFNVLINTKIMKDTALKNKIEKELKQIEEEGVQRADKILENVENMVTGR